MAPKSQTGKYALLYLILLIIGMTVVLGRCYFLQTQQVQQAVQRAQRQQHKVVKFSQRRGDIVDSRLRKLAVSVKHPSVWIDPSFVRADEETDLLTKQKHIASQLATILNMDSNKLLQDLQQRSDRRFMWVQRFIQPHQAQLIEVLDLPGVVISYEYRRHYPMGDLAGHILGFTDIDGIGVSGVETQYNKDLMGHEGQLLSLSDVRRRSVYVKEGSRLPVDGKTIVLTIDAEIQQFVQSQLAEVVEKFNAENAIAIVMDPATGDILALANHPSFHPVNDRANVARQRNIALTDTYEPGSTFKPFTVCAGIDGGYVNIDQTIDCTTSGIYGGPGFRAVREYNNRAYGVLTVAGIIKKSSNIGVVKIAQMMGADAFYEGIMRFGFGRPTGIDLPGEAAGLPRDRIVNGNLVTMGQQLKNVAGAPTALTRVAFGQTIAVTPIQLITAFCAISNGGHPVVPRILKDKIDCDIDDIQSNSWFSIITSQKKPEPPRRAGRIVDTKTAKDVIEKGMVEVVSQGGTATSAALEKWQVYGKTGTANIARSDGRGYETNKWVASFLGGAPAENPKIVVLVVVRDPDRSLGLGYTGGVVTAPAARNIIEHTLTYLKVPHSPNRQSQEQAD